jgi:hypothetical protein
MEVPTLAPMLHIRFTIVDTTLLFSCGMPIYAAAVTGMKIRSIGMA